MKVVINRSDALGDLLLTTPMAALIKEVHPQAHITFIISNKCRDLLENHPHIDQYFILDCATAASDRFRKLHNLFSELHPECYFHVGGSHAPSMVAHWKRVGFRGGLLSKWPSFLFLNEGVRQSRSRAEFHESDYNLQLLAPLGIEYQLEKRSLYRPHISIAKDASDILKTFKGNLESAGLSSDREMIFIHPGMSGHTLNWPSKNYSRLILELEECFPARYNYIISYTPSDAPYVDVVKSELESGNISNYYFFNGASKGLADYMSVLTGAACLIAPSTGVTHIANALGVKQVALYSPLRSQCSRRWGPFLSHLGCEVLSPQSGSMDSLSTKDVADSVCRVLEV